MPSEPALTAQEELAWRAIEDNATLALSFVEGLTAAQFASDRRTFYAVTRCLEIISEAARRLRGAQQDRTPHLEWRQIEDSGNVFRHAYQVVAEDRVWMTVRERLPALVEAAQSALAKGRENRTPR
ncbi:MAG: HepT-like ribonuclease domain-containing protein [Caulobacteraceae bacterium]